MRNTHVIRQMATTLFLLVALGSSSLENVCKRVPDLAEMLAISDKCELRCVNSEIERRCPMNIVVPPWPSFSLSHLVPRRLMYRVVFSRLECSGVVWFFLNMAVLFSMA